MSFIFVTHIFIIIYASGATVGFSTVQYLNTQQ